MGIRAPRTQERKEGIGMKINVTSGGCGGWKSWLHLLSPGSSGHLVHPGVPALVHD